MLRLKPLPEEKATEYTKSVYDSIKTTLGVPTPPLFFQYIGNYPDYLGYLWSIVAPNIDTEGFQKSCNQLLQISESAISVIYTPSEKAKALSSKMHPSEKEQLQKTIDDLRLLNVKMMILTIAIRESLKGLYIISKQISDGSYRSPAAPQEAEKTIDEIVQESLQSVSASNMQTFDTKVAHMLVPVYGANALMISKYPEFFSLSAEELETLMKTEAYLKARVEMEKITHILLLQLPSPIHLSYIETTKMLFNQPYAGDLLFVMKDTFPSHFPKLVLATDMMEKMIQS